MSGAPRIGDTPERTGGARRRVLGAVEQASELGRGATVVTVACDTGLKYLAGDLSRT